MNNIFWWFRNDFEFFDVCLCFYFDSMCIWLCASVRVDRSIADARTRFAHDFSVFVLEFVLCPKCVDFFVFSSDWSRALALKMTSKNGHHIRTDHENRDVLHVIRHIMSSFPSRKCSVPIQAGCEAFVLQVTEKPIKEDRVRCIAFSIGCFWKDFNHDVGGAPNSNDLENLIDTTLKRWTKKILHASSNSINHRAWCRCLSFQITEPSADCCS